MQELSMTGMFWNISVMYTPTACPQPHPHIMAHLTPQRPHCHPELRRQIRSTRTCAASQAGSQ
eukprot:3940973-Rhodomonas_salina.4